MRFPNKLISAKESSLPLFTLILSKLEQTDYTPLRLYNEIKKLSAFKKTNTTFTDYIQILDCLFILGKVEIIGEEVLHYVETN